MTIDAAGRTTLALAVVTGVALLGFQEVRPVEGGAPASGITAAADTVARTAALLPLPARPDRTAAWMAPGYGHYVVDDFEATVWPDADRWPLLVDLTAQAEGAYLWAPRDCRASGGSESLWATGGGAVGGAQACGTDAPDGRQTSALLALDLAVLGGAARLDLLLDVWADAAPTEGLLLNVVTFGPDGSATDRHVVFSATGRSIAWSREVAIDLTSLRDRLDASWTGDLRGQLAYLELLFVSDASVTGKGTGIYVDNIAVRSSPPTPIVVTSVPLPTATPSATEESDRTEACSTEPDCRSLLVWSYVDYRCDRRFQPGVDERVNTGPRVEIVAGSERLGTSLDARGYATFRLPSANGATVTLAVPDGYEDCGNSANPRVLRTEDFSRFGLTTVELRLQRSR